MRSSLLQAARNHAAAAPKSYCKLPLPDSCPRRALERMQTNI
jgi:hypothetical protein